MRQSRPIRLAHAAAVTSRHVCMAEARKSRCVLAEVSMALDVERVVGGRMKGEELLGCPSLLNLCVPKS